MYVNRVYNSPSAKQLKLDIMALQKEIAHLITLRPYVPEFLDELRRCGKYITLVTNAPSKSFELKMQHTQLKIYFDRIISSHETGFPKESQNFWQQLQIIHPFQPHATLLIDDNLTVLRAAKIYGIAHLLAIFQPNSHAKCKDVAEFNAIHQFMEIMPCCLSER